MGLLFLSPDGRTLAFLHQASGQTRLARVEVDGSGFRELPTSGSPYRMLTWSRDGRALFFGQMNVTGTSTPEVRIMRMPAMDGAPEFTGLTLKGVSNGDAIDLNADGSRLIFSAGSATISP